MSRPVPALSDLSVTEFLTLSRMGFLPHALVVGASVYEADTRGSAGRVDLIGALFGGKPLVQMPPTGEVVALSEAVRSARALAIERMRAQAAQAGAEGVVGVRLHVEHHLWRGGHQVAKFVAIVSHGMAVQAVGGAKRDELARVAEIAIGAWPT